MLSSELDDELAIRLGEGVERDDEPLGTLLDRCLERGPQISSLPNVEELGFDAQGSRRALNLFPRRWHGRATHVAQGRDPNGFRNQRVEKLNTFRIQLCDHRVQTCDVPAGAGETRHEALRDGVARSRDDDGNRVRSILGRQNRLRPPRYDHVHFDPNQVGRQLGGSVLDDEVLPST
jgi:hypothetical protein